MLRALLIAQAETALPRGDIFDQLWAGEGSGRENVVDVYVGYLRKKIGHAEFGFEIKTQRNKSFCLTGRVPVLDVIG